MSSLKVIKHAAPPPKQALEAETGDLLVKLQVRVTPDQHEKILVRLARMRPKKSIQAYLMGLLQADGIE